MKKKDDLIAEAHKNPEYATMSAKQLATIIDADQSTISVWRRKVRDMAAGWRCHGNTLKAGVTVESVRKNWEEKYASLDKQYDYIADRLIDMAKKADKHRNNEKDLEEALSALQQRFDGALASIEHYRQLLAQERAPWYKKLFSSKG